MTRSLVFSAIAGPANEHSREALPPFGSRATLVLETSPLLDAFCEQTTGKRHLRKMGRLREAEGYMLCTVGIAS